MNFKTFIILSIIFIYTTIKARILFKRYTTAVEGGVKCRYNNYGMAIIILSTNPYPKIDRYPCAMKFTRYGSPFFINAKLFSYRRPFFYLKIAHTCMFNPDGRYARILVRGIPKKYVLKQKRPRYMPLSYIELANTPGALYRNKFNLGKPYQNHRE